MILSNGLVVFPYYFCKAKPIGEPLPKLELSDELRSFYSQHDLLLYYDPNWEENMNNITDEEKIKLAEMGKMMEEKLVKCIIAGEVDIDDLDISESYKNKIMNLVAQVNKNI